MKKQPESRPSSPQGLTPDEAFSRAVALHRGGKLSDAEAMYRSVLAAHPDNVRVLNLLGTLERQRGNWGECIRLTDKAIALHPGNADALGNRAIAHHVLRQFADALADYDKAIALNPGNADLHSNRGIVCYELGRYDDARASYDNAIALNPDHAMAYNNRGLLLYRLKHYDDALADYDTAVALNPHYAEACNNRGLALYEQRRYDDAAASYDKAIALNPQYAEAYSNRGLLFFRLKDFKAALEHYDKAIALNPHYTEAYWNKSGLLLLTGEYEEGWRLFEWRWRRQDAGAGRTFPCPLWLGAEPLMGKTILLHAEQGLGDTLQFCRYAPLVERMGATVVLEVQKPLAALLATLAGARRIVAQGSALPECDFHCPLMSLPLAFRTTLENIPAAVPYLAADPRNREPWRARLGAKSKPRIGLVWSGSPTQDNDANRSIPLALLAPLLKPGAEFHALQKEIRREDAEFLTKHRIALHAHELHDFVDTASLVSEMDMVIAVDTSVAHLAGSLGKPLWLLLSFVPSYRWLAEGEENPWYPSARLFRQHRIHDWESVVAEVAAELERWLA